LIGGRLGVLARLHRLLNLAASATVGQSAQNSSAVELQADRTRLEYRHVRGGHAQDQPLGPNEFRQYWMIDAILDRNQNRITQIGGCRSDGFVGSLGLNREQHQVGAGHVGYIPCPLDRDRV
jgi:hypothetical protein